VYSGNQDLDYQRDTRTAATRKARIGQRLALARKKHIIRRAIKQPFLFAVMAVAEKAETAEKRRILLSSVNKRGNRYSNNETLFQNLDKMRRKLAIGAHNNKTGAVWSAPGSV
jgi:hypothetical protein